MLPPTTPPAKPCRSPRASARQNGAGLTVAELLGVPVTSRGSYATPINIDPFTVSLDDKLAPAAGCGLGDGNRTPGNRSHGQRGVHPRGTHLRQHRGRVGEPDHLRGPAAASRPPPWANGETQRRSYPQSPRSPAGFAPAGEYVVAMDLPGNARRTAEEAAELLTADPCPTDINTDLIIDSSQLALQIHESCGHAVELDRALGDEAALCRNIIPDAGPAARFPVRLRARQHHRRQHQRHRAWHLRVGRRRDCRPRPRI